MRSNQGTLESRMQGNLARPVWGWGPGEIPGPTPLFVASLTGGRRAAILFSLIASAKANQVEPWAWLREVFTQLPLLAAPAGAMPAGTSAVDSLLPDRWLQANPTHRWQINDLRQKERQRSQHLRRQKRRRS